MLGQVFAIARITLVEALRQPIFFVIVLLSGVMQVFNTLLSAYSMDYSDDDLEVMKDDKLLFDMGLATVLVCGTLLAAFVATSVLSREIENKTALTVISKPVGRPIFVLGKYLGVAAATAVAVVIMIAFFLFAIRHGVMSTARDSVDGPVVLFASLSVLFSVGLGIWGNFFYGWVFPSTVVGALLPTSVLGYLAATTISKEWAFQSPVIDFKPQVLIASGGVALAMFVLTAIAIAASTRLSQVMTITVCAGSLLLGLLSNHLIGRFAFENRAVAEIVSVDKVRVDLAEAGAALMVILDRPPDADLTPGTPIYYGPTPEGLGLTSPPQEPFVGDPTDAADLLDPAMGRALIVGPPRIDAEELTEAGLRPELQLMLLNANGLPLERNPEIGDFIFTRPTEVRGPAFAAWSIVPNLQFFWLIDPVTQGHEIPLSYIGLMLLYTLVQVTGLVALAVLLFQRRDVG